MEKFDWKLTIKANIASLKVLGLWPEGNEGYKKNLYTLYAFISLNLFVNGHNFFQTMNIFFVYTDLQALTALVFITITDLMALVKVYYFVRNMKQLKNLMVTLDEKLFQPKYFNQKLVFISGLNFWKFTYVLYHIPVVPTLSAWIVYPVLDGSAKDYRLPFSAWYPYNTKISPFYQITYIYQIVSIWFMAFSALNMDALMAALMMFVGAQCDILADNVKNLGHTDYNTHLLECVKHHKKILSFAADCNKFFDKIALGQFFTSALTLALTMFQLTVVAPLSSEFYSLLFYAGAMTTEIFLYCWFGNEAEIKNFGKRGTTIPKS
ncbi:hypothetical protein Zmor_007651 [Zophobas morio]|uniref:7tm 6 domain containing protein n=1 Tax=Zophobas morio TaxID=2755281 RepID=A0AA38J2F6_9CUCU|nr:hypothetical protein Zmor_007651 [Zophobas morio]